MTTRAIIIAMATILVAGALCAAQPAEDEKSKVTKKLLGTWQLQKGVVGGVEMPEQAAQKLSLDLTDGKYVLKGAESPDEGTWSIDVAKKPFKMDIKGENGPNKGKTFLCIFELDADKLKVCYDLAGKKRPTKFESPKKTLNFLAEYKRVKKKSE
jgi:uncharacterized protein (TIGR03067 family)